MTVALPTPDQLRAVADQCGLALTDEDVERHVQRLLPEIEQLLSSD